jgi:hypothetical protein
MIPRCLGGGGGRRTTAVVAQSRQAGQEAWSARLHSRLLPTIERAALAPLGGGLPLTIRSHRGCGAFSSLPFQGAIETARRDG